MRLTRPCGNSDYPQPVLRYLGWAVLFLVFYPLRAGPPGKTAVSLQLGVLVLPHENSPAPAYSVFVRAADLDSGIQRDGPRDPFPDGAERLHRTRFNILLG